MYCPKCGTENKDGVKFCANCGGSFANASAANAIVSSDMESEPTMEASIESHSTRRGTTVTNISVQAPQTKSNPMGVAGFILALIGVFVSWIPVLGWIVWILGAVLSIIGLFKQPKGMAIAGVVLTFIDAILLLFVVSSCAAIGGLAMM